MTNDKVIGWYMGPTDWDADPGKMWHTNCSQRRPTRTGEVLIMDSYATCLMCGETGRAYPDDEITGYPHVYRLNGLSPSQPSDQAVDDALVVWRDRQLNQVQASPREHVIAILQAGMPALRRQIYRELGDDEYHIIEFYADDESWTMKHPLACRPDLFNCPVNLAARTMIVEAVWQPPGRYECHLDENNSFVVGERIN